MRKNIIDEKIIMLITNRWLMRNLGGYFIRRRHDTSPGEKDHTYRAVLAQVINLLLKQFLVLFLMFSNSLSVKGHFGGTRVLCL